MAHVMVVGSFNQDIFVCGNCKSVYNSLPHYLEHKRLICNNVIIEEPCATYEVSPATFEEPPVTYIQIPSSYEESPATYVQLPTTYEEAPAAYVQPPTTYENLPVTYVQSPTIYEELLPVPYEEPPAPYAEPPATYAELPATYAEPPATYEEPPATYDEPPATYAEPSSTYEETPSTFEEAPSTYEASSTTCEESAATNENTPASENLQRVQEPNLITKDASTQFTQESDSESFSEDNVVIEIKDNNRTCEICFKKFKTRKGFVGHVKLHKGKSYQCCICGRCFMQNSHLQRHISTHKMWPGNVRERTPKTVEADLLSYSCPYCNQICPNFNKFRYHMKGHTSLKQYKCAQEGCLSFCDNMSTLIEHVSQMHPTPVYVCHICSEKFNNLKDIAVHQRKHNVFGIEPKPPSKQYKCSQCDAVFKHPEKLSFHMFAENHNKVCIHCNKRFVSEKRLRMHLQIHRESKPFECHYCGSSFHLKKYLITHMLRHGNRTYKCSVCKSKFKRPDLLRRHMRLHQSKKMYPCTFKDCKKEFSRLDKLKAHLKLHSKSVPTQKKKKKEKSSAST